MQHRFMVAIERESLLLELGPGPKHQGPWQPQMLGGPLHVLFCHPTDPILDTRPQFAKAKLPALSFDLFEGK